MALTEPNLTDITITTKTKTSFDSSDAHLYFIKKTKTKYTLAFMRNFAKEAKLNALTICSSRHYSRYLSANKGRYRYKSIALADN